VVTEERKPIGSQQNGGFNGRVAKAKPRKASETTDA
jgi:hypothetical protein